MSKKKLNALAGLFYKMQGYNAGDGYEFDKARHPQERAMFEFAKVSKQFWDMVSDKKDLRDEYKRGVEFIALNDDPGSSQAMEVEHVQHQISVITMSEILNKPAKQIAKDIVKYRKAKGV
jgi:hypothetical protein